MERKKGSKERGKGKGPGKEGKMERRKERETKGRRQGGASKEKTELWQERVFFGDHVTVCNCSWGPMENPKRKENEAKSYAIWPAGGAISISCEGQTLGQTRRTQNKPKVSVSSIFITFPVFPFL